MSALDDLRAEVRRRQQAANAKARRLRAKGIEITGTEHDPRRSGAPINRYTRQQLTNYLDRLNAFTSRSNQFTRLSSGFVTAAEWREYKRPERQYNRIGKREYNSVAGIKLPNQDETIEQRDEKLRPKDSKIRRAAGPVVRRIYDPVNLRPEQVASPEALRKLIAFRKRQVTRKYKPEELARQREEMRKMVKDISDPEITKATEGLTADQFNLLWNYGSFATDLSRDYQRAKLLATGGAEAQQDRVHEDARADIVDAVKWAKENIPETGAFRKPRRK